ncbi:MAG: T9SS type A sorting domain-containing protein, partial [Parafilimonas sp.]
SNFNHVIINNSNGVSLARSINVAGNFSNNGLFNANNYTVTFDGSTTQSIGGTAATAFDYLTNTNTSASVTMNKNVTVNKTLSLLSNSFLSINGNTLTLHGDIDNSSSYTGTITGSPTSNIHIGGTTGGSLGTLNFTNSAQQVNNITINRTGGTSANPARAILGTNLTASDITLTNGIIATGNNLFTWNNTGSLTQPTTYTDSYIATCDAAGTSVPESATVPFNGLTGFRIDNVSNTDTYFPVGATYSPAGIGLTPSPNRIMINNTYTPQSFTVVINKGDIGRTDGARVNRIWYVKAALDTATANMKLFFTERDPINFLTLQDEVETGFMYSDIRLVQKDYAAYAAFISLSSGTDIRSIPFNSGQEAYAQYTIGVSADYNGATIGINEFNRFSIVNRGTIILPVTITNLTGLLQNHTIQLNWKSLNEINIERYEIERSANGFSFTTIGTKAALNNGSLETDYTFTDFTPQPGNNYYRIKVVEQDGSITYTNIVLVQTTAAKMQITVMPNPVINKKTSIQFINAEAGKYNLALYNVSGKKVWQQWITLAAGSSTYTMQLQPGVAAGIYFLHVENEKMDSIEKLIVE